jgi:hypothetical protein
MGARAEPEVARLAAAAQDSSQEFKGGNLALQRNMDTSTPVRVCRGKLGASKERKYVYEGLYNVVGFTQVGACPLGRAGGHARGRQALHQPPAHADGPCIRHLPMLTGPASATCPC